MKERRKTHSIGKTILAVVIVILLLAGAGYFTYVYFQVDHIKVTGNSVFSAGEIAKLADIQPKTHMFFVDTEEIKQKIETEPHVEVNSITKEYPKTLVVDITERVPEAVTSFSDQFLLLDVNANVMEMHPEQPEGTYPLVTGFAIDAVNLGKQISTQDGFKVTVYSELITALDDKEIKDKIATIDLSDINNIKLTTRDGLSIKFGQSDKITDKVKIIKKMLPKVNASGELDVSLGISATTKLNKDDEPQEPQEPAEPDPNEGGE